MSGFERQTFKNFEIIIADDGSPQDTIKEIENIANDFSFPLKHLWQNGGFRKNKILNKAIMSSDSDYLIFIDGDCIPHKEFIREHFENSSPGICLTGRRVNLSEKITRLLTPENIQQGYMESQLNKLIIDGIFGESYDVEKGFYFGNIYIRNFFNKKKRGILGCNFSLHKKDFLSINGFDERYVAPSIGEDSDVQYRLELNGVQIRSLNNIAVQYHLYHKLQKRPDKNLVLYLQVKDSGKYFTPYGILKQL